MEKLFIKLFTTIGYYSGRCFSKFDELKKSFTSKIKSRHAKRSKKATANASEISSNESDDEIGFISNSDNSVDISNKLIALQISDDGTNMDYEAGGD